MLSLFFVTSGATTACYCTESLQNECNVTECDETIQSINGYLRFQKSYDKLWVYSNEESPTYNIHSKYIPQGFQIESKKNNNINIYIRIDKEPTCNEIKAGNNVALQYGGYIYYPFTVTPNIDASELLFEKLILKAAAKITLRDTDFDVECDGKKETMKIETRYGLVISTEKTTEIKGNSVSLKGLVTKTGTTTSINGIKTINKLDIETGSNLKIETDCDVLRGSITIGLKSSEQTKCDFTGHTVKFGTEMDVFASETSDSMFIQSYQIFANADKFTFKDIDRTIRYTDANEEKYSARMTISKEGMVNFRINANAALDPSVDAHTKKEIFGDVYYTEKTSEEIANNFNVISLALYSKEIDLSNIKFVDGEDRKLINRINEEITINMTNIRSYPLTTYGDFNVTGASGKFIIRSGTTKLSSGVSVIDIYPGGVLKPLEGFSAGSVYVWFNPTGCGQIAYDTAPSSGFSINAKYDSVTQTGVTSLSYEIVKNGGAAFKDKIQVEDKMFAYKGYRYTVTLTDSTLTLKKDENPVTVVCFGVLSQSECPEGSVFVENLVGFSGITEINVGSEVDIPYSAVADRFEIKAGRSKVTLSGDKKGKTVVVTGQDVSLIGPIESIEVNPLSEVFTDQLSIKSAIVRYDTKETTMLCFKDIPEVEEKIKVIKDKTKGPSVAIKKLVVGINKNYSEEDLKGLRSKIDGKVVYGSLPSHTGFRPDNSDDEGISTGAIIAIVIVVIAVVAGAAFGVFYLLKRRNSNSFKSLY